MEGFRQHFEGFKRWDRCQVGPLTPATLSDNIDSSTCPGRLSSLVWDPPVMIYAFLKSLGLPINQVSHSSPPVPLTLYHSPPILLPNCPPSISHHSIHKSTHCHSFCTPSAPQLHPSLPCSLPLHFSLFFGTIYGCPLLLMPFPTFLHHIGLFSHTTCPLHYPSHPLPLPAPLPTHFWGAMNC